MAKIDKLETPIIFYLYNSEWTLNKRDVKIMSPYNKIVKVAENKYLPDIINKLSVTFEWWMYECHSEQEAEWLRLYNNRGGTITIGDKTIPVKWNMINQVKEEAPVKKVVERVVTEKVNVEVFPKMIAETMTPDQLKELCISWNVSFTKDTVTREDYIKLLEESERLY